MSPLLGYFIFPSRNSEKRGQTIVTATSLIILTNAVQPVRHDTPASLFSNLVKPGTLLGSTTYREIQFASGVTYG